MHFKHSLYRKVQHEATWFSAGDCLLSGGGILRHQSERIPFLSRQIDLTVHNMVSLAIPGLLFLLYPLVGHLTDVYLTRYRSLKWSFCFLILAVSMGIFLCEAFSCSSVSMHMKNLSNSFGTVVTHACMSWLLSFTCMFTYHWTRIVSG